MSDDGWPRPARGWGWLDWVPPIVGFLLGGWLLFSLSWLVGVEPGDHVITRGTAEVGSCSRDPVRLWLVVVCDAEVDLAEVPMFPQPAHREAAESATGVTATHGVEGRIPVELVWHGWGRYGGPGIYDVVPLVRQP